MKKEDIKEYFEKYIEPYSAYRNDKLFVGLVNFLVDYYYDDLYSKVPNDLKTLYEDQELKSSVYDKFLIAIGVPQEVINKLNYKEKIIFLKSLSDFRRYKGTIDFIRKIGKSFDDTFNVYELFIDYDPVNSDWIFKPVIIYQDTSLKVVEEKIPYEAVYDSVPNFLIHKNQLENLRVNNQITLPIKSNILLLDEQIVNDISLLNNLIISTFLKEYKNNYVNIYFTDSQYSLTINSIYYAWYYLTCRYYGTEWLKIPSSTYMLQFDEFHNPFSIYDLKDLLDEYQELSNNQEIDNFYQNNFEFFSQYVQSEDLTVVDMKNRLDNLDNGFSDYIENRITNSINERKEIDLIVNEIFSSLLYFRDTYNTSIGISANDPFLEYVDYFFASLPQLTINPEDTTSYILLYNFKPYHTELMSTISNVLTYQDKFSSTILSDRHWFHFEMIKYELLSLIDEKYLEIDLYKQSDASVADVAYIHGALVLNDNLEEQVGDTSRNMLLLEYIAASIQQNDSSVVSLNDMKDKIDQLKDSLDSLGIVSSAKVFDGLKRMDNLNFDWDFLLTVTEVITENLNISSEIELEFTTNLDSSVSLDSVISKTGFIMIQNTNITPGEDPIKNVDMPVQGDIYQIDDMYTII